METRDFIRDRWMRLTRNLQIGSSEHSETYLHNVIIPRYTEQHRHYHTLEHIAYMLHQLDLVPNDPHIDRDSIELAIFFHDIVYDVSASGQHGDNERASAEMFVQFCREVSPTLSDTAARRVERYILQTMDHMQCTERDDLGLLLFLDLDLSILGDEWDRYDLYARQVQREYSPIFDDQQFRVGRLRFLESMKRAPTLYFTPHGRTLWEDRARDNMQREETGLRSVLADILGDSGVFQSNRL